MHTLLFLLFSGWTVNMAGISAQVDTIDSYQVGPGVVYTEFLVTKANNKVRTFHMLDVDLNNSNNDIEVRLGNDRLNVSETLLTSYKRWDKPAHRMVGAINCTPYIMSVHETQIPEQFAGLAGYPAYAVCTNGIPAVSHTMYDRGYADADDNYESGYLAIDANKRAYVNDFYFSGSAVLPSATLNVNYLNHAYTILNGGKTTVFNSLRDKTPKHDCVEVIFTVDEWKTNSPMTCKVTAKNTTGGTTLTATQGAMQGVNDDKQYVNALNVGDTFTLQLNLTARDGSTSTQVTQLTGGYSLNMFADTLTPRNFDEAYSANDYPRPMIGTNKTGDHVWLLEFQTPGMSTAEGCYLLQHLGASSAAAFDGGGSAQMLVNGEYKLRSSDAGGERALPVSLWVVSTETDESVGRLAFVNPLTSVPGYASYTPTIRSWTKEGLLLSHDFQDYTLTCEPASLGTCSGHTFTAAPLDAEGVLVATYGDVRATTPIAIRDGKVRFRLDSVVLDTDYEVEVQSIAGDLILPMSGKAMQWQSEDENVVTVTEGVVHPVAHDGRTQVIGSLGSSSDTLVVWSQKASAHHLSVPLLEQRMVTDTTFQLTSARSGNLVLPMDYQLYGCPDSLLIVFECSASVASIELTYRAFNGNQPQSYKMAQACAASTLSTYSFALNKLLDTADRGIYWVELNKMKVMFKDPKANKDYTMHINDIIQCYNRWEEVTGLDELKNSTIRHQSTVKLMVDGQIYMVRDGVVYTLQGQIVER